MNKNSIIYKDKLLHSFQNDISLSFLCILRPRPKYYRVGIII